LDLAGQSCATLSLGTGTLTCASDCTFDRSGCSANAACGNGVREGTEQCDGLDLNSMTCALLNLGSGNLSCQADCSFDTSGCSQQSNCGDNVLQGAEQCDGSNLGGKSCQTVGQNFEGGSLSCRSDCTFDTSLCSKSASCGNGVVEAGEQCDTTNFKGATCQTMGFAGGVLNCTGSCQLDTSGCNDKTEICDNSQDDDGDGFVDCDDADCHADAHCGGQTENCTNGIDDDQDGATDCDDVDCSNDTACSSTGEICDNGTDDDGNFLCDCNDIFSCLLDMVCLLAPTNESNCSDGQDEDHDCLVDCADDDCTNTVACGGTPEDCSNGVDDDDDGKTDCDDSDCVNDTHCSTTEDCSNTIDDDSDGKTDCDDSDCFGNSACPTCHVEQTLACGAEVDSSTSSNPSIIDNYGSGTNCAQYTDSGPETSFLFQTASGASVTMTLSASNREDLDLIVVGGDSSDCDVSGNACIAASQENGATDENVSFDASGGTTYYVIVDGYDGAHDDFHLSVTCN